MHKVYSHQALGMVQLAQHELAQHGIESFIRGEYLVVASGGVPPQDAWVELFVGDDERAGEAAALIHRFMDEASDALEEWTCPSCGEKVDGHFAVCWNCGHAAE